jgi:hypothetical protein
LHPQILKGANRNMKRLIIVAALTCAVSLSAFAGNIPTVGIAPPPPPPPDGIQATNTTALGDIPSGGSSYEITETALDLIQMFLGVGV